MGADKAYTGRHEARTVPFPRCFSIEALFLLARLDFCHRWLSWLPLVMRGALVGNGGGAGRVKEFALAGELAFEADDLVAELEDDLVLLADVKLEMGVVFLQPG